MQPEEWARKVLWLYEFQSSSLTEKGCSGLAPHETDAAIHVSILIPY